MILSGRIVVDESRWLGTLIPVIPITYHNLFELCRALAKCAQHTVDLQLDVLSTSNNDTSPQLPGEQVSANSLPNASMARIWQNRSRPNAFVPMSLGVAISETPNLEIRAMLLSVFACTKNDRPISLRMACVKINPADSAPRSYNSDSTLDKATVPCP